METAVQPSSAAENSAEQQYLALIRQSLKTMRDGDFSVRLPVTWTGLAGAIAEDFNEIVAANEQMAREFKRVGQVASSTTRAPGTRWKGP